MGNHYPVWVEGTGTQLWRCAVCGHEEFMDDVVASAEQFNSVTVDCSGMNPVVGGVTEPITRKAFLDRFTYAEIAAIKTSTDSNVVAYLYKFEQSESVDLSLPEVFQGLQYLASIGLLSPERPAEIVA